MSITSDSLRLQAQLDRQIDQIVDQQTRDLTASWVRAYDETAGDLDSAIRQLLADSQTGIVAKALVVRNQKLLASLDYIGRRLMGLANEAGVRVIGDVRQVVQTAADAQAAIIGAQLPAGYDLEGTVSGSTIDAIVSRTAQQITSQTFPLGVDAYDAMRRELLRGVVVGANPNHTAARIMARVEGRFNGGLARAITIARTETLDAYRAGAGAGQAGHADVLTGWVWSAHIGPRTCPACLSMNGREFPLTTPGPEGHQNCVLPGAVVSGPRASASTTRWFDGEVIDLETVDGRRLSVTPNHPVLTPHGWVAAGLLGEGDEVVGGGVGEGPAGRGRPDDHQVPALIEDVAETLGTAGPVQAVRVPTAPEDFHGDGAGSDVHVVRTHRLLRRDVETSGAELLGEPSLMVRDVGLPNLAGQSSLALLLERPDAATHRSMSSGGVPRVLLGRTCRHHQTVRVGGTALLDPGVFQEARDVATGDAEVGSEGLDGLPGVVSLDYPMPVREDLARFVGPVAVVLVLRVSRRWYSGHVYNLQTETGWYVANEIVTHNCRCARVPKTKTWAELGIRGMDEPVDPMRTPAGTRAWFEALPEADQVAIMGPERLALLRSGAIGWDDLAALRSTPGWRDSYTITPVRVLRALAARPA